MDILNFPVVGQNKQSLKVVPCILTDSSAISYRRALRVKMFRLFFVLALAFLLSSFAKSKNKSANQVTKLIARLEVIIRIGIRVKVRRLVFCSCLWFPKQPLDFIIYVYTAARFYFQTFNRVMEQRQNQTAAFHKLDTVKMVGKTSNKNPTLFSTFIITLE